MLSSCPFKYKRFDPNTGELKTGVSGSRDGHNTRACNTGKGVWCLQCQHFNQYKVSHEAWMKTFVGLKKSGKAPWLRKKIDRERFEKIGVPGLV